jgi:hypothetical protein
VAVAGCGLGLVVVPGYLSVALADSLSDVFFILLFHTGLLFARFDNYRIIGEKTNPELNGKKALQGLQGLRIDPAFDFLTPAFHTDKPGLTQFLNVVGNSRSNNAQVLTQLTHAGPGLAFRVVAEAGDSARLTARDQTQKYSEAVGVGQGLEHIGEFSDGVFLIVRHVSKYIRCIGVCQVLFSGFNFLYAPATLLRDQGFTGSPGSRESELVRVKGTDKPASVYESQ